MVYIWWNLDNNNFNAWNEYWCVIMNQSEQKVKIEHIEGYQEGQKQTIKDVIKIIDDMKTMYETALTCKTKASHKEIFKRVIINLENAKQRVNKTR